MMGNIEPVFLCRLSFTKNLLQLLVWWTLRIKTQIVINGVFHCTICVFYSRKIQSYVCFNAIAMTSINARFSHLETSISEKFRIGALAIVIIIQFKLKVYCHFINRFRKFQLFDLSIIFLSLSPHQLKMTVI